MAVPVSPMIRTPHRSGAFCVDEHRAASVCSSGVMQCEHMLEHASSADIAEQTEHLERVIATCAPEGRARIRAALAFAGAQHAGQFRKVNDHVPYLVHPVRVAVAVADTFGIRNADVLTAALLHDVVEDCGVTVPTIQAQFGDHVAAMVAQLTFDRDDTAKWRQAAALCRADANVRSVKAADIIDNTRDYARTSSAKRSAV